MRWVKETDSLEKHLTPVVWECPKCEAEAVRYDSDKKLFVCWNCCYTLTENEGHQKLEGF